MIKFITLMVLIACVASDETRWKSFKNQHGKKYHNATHEAERKAEFMKNAERVDKHNALYAAGKVSYRRKLHHFSDKTNDEARLSLCGLVVPPKSRALPQSFQTPDLFPVATAASVDYRSMLQPVADQNPCGSCWAFSTIAQLEYLYKKKYNTNVTLSKQFLVDCEKVDHGCSGGWPSNAMNFLQSNGAIKESDYPYTFPKVAGTCQTSDPVMPNIITTVTEFDVDQGLTETTMKNILAKDGPFVITVEAGDSFMHYDSGILADTTCGTCAGINHGVLLVGYGTAVINSVSLDYWLIRNSWTAEWGEQGYIRIQRGKNICGMACHAMYMT